MLIRSPAPQDTCLAMHSLLGSLLLDLYSRLTCLSNKTSEDCLKDTQIAPRSACLPNPSGSHLITILMGPSVMTMSAFYNLILAWHHHSRDQSCYQERCSQCTCGYSNVLMGGICVCTSKHVPLTLELPGIDSSTSRNKWN